MAKRRNQASKADVQSTEQNKMPVPGESDVEFSAEEAAEVFEKQQNQSAQRSVNNRNKQ